MTAGITLLEFATRIKRRVASAPEIANQWVMAELSDVNRRGGHCYLELVQKNEGGSTVAKMRATIWAGNYARIAARFRAGAGRELAGGLKVMLYGSASFHEAFGLSFNVIDIDPAYTMGDIERIRREIMAQLTKEGVAEVNRSLLFPQAPQRIAVISAPGAAGYGDFCNQLAANAEGLVTYPHLFAAVMQGEKTAPSVLGALDRIEMTVDLWDCVVIIRGGGSTTDLNGFDNLELARRVATFPLPVIVGIGHERDRTVLDELANTRVKTPTAAAELLLFRLREAYARATDLATAAARIAAERLEGCRLQLSQFETLIPAAGRQRVAEARTRLSRIAAAIPAAASARTARERQRLDFFVTSLRDAVAARFERERTRLGHLDEMTKMLSPANTLKRGYSITRIGGKAVRSAAEVPAGAHITTTLCEGSIESTTE